MFDVADSRELRAAALAMKRLPPEVRRAISQDVRGEFNPVWKQEIAGRAQNVRSPGNRILNSGVRVAGGNPPQLIAASSKRGLGKSKRLVPDRDWRGFEFGTPDRNQYSRYKRRNRSGNGSHTVERRTMRAMPPRSRSGHVVYPAAAEVAPRVASYWTQTIVRKTHEAFEGK